MSYLPDLPNIEWMKNFLSKENLPQLPEMPDISFNKGDSFILLRKCGCLQDVLWESQIPKE